MLQQLEWYGRRDPFTFATLPGAAQGAREANERLRCGSRSLQMSIPGLAVGPSRRRRQTYTPENAMPGWLRALHTVMRALRPFKERHSGRGLGDPHALADLIVRATTATPNVSCAAAYWFAHWRRVCQLTSSCLVPGEAPNSMRSAAISGAGQRRRRRPHARLTTQASGSAGYLRAR